MTVALAEAYGADLQVTRVVVTGGDVDAATAPRARVCVLRALEAPPPSGAWTPTRAFLWQRVAAETVRKRIRMEPPMSQPLDPAASPWQPDAAGGPTELFAPPSGEHGWLLRHASWLVAPEDGRGPALGRFLRMAMVAPMTQLTFLSFDLQVFLYGVFHTTRTARAGHFVFQAAVTFWLLVAACAVEGLRGDVAAPDWRSLNGSTGLAVLLLGWYLAMAWQHRLWAWFLAMVPVVGALYAGANLLYATWALPAGAPGAGSTALPLALDPWLWMAGSAFLVALSHAPEPKLPPRTVEGERWLTFGEYLRSAETATPRPLRALRVGLFPLWGTLDEWWASPRLMPYGVLLVMFRFGYRPELWHRCQQQVERAWASGNPALDYVGIGGGAMLRPRGGGETVAQPLEAPARRMP